MPAAKKQAVQKEEKPVAADKKKTAKKGGAKAAPKKKVTLQQRVHALFHKHGRHIGIGQGLPVKRNMTHFVKMPQYVRLARQKRVLLNRLKVPPPINLFSHTLDKATVVSLFKFLNEMRPEEKQAAKKRHLEEAAKIAHAIKPKEKDGKPGKEKTKDQRRDVIAMVQARLKKKAPARLRFGLNNVTNLVEKNKAQLVVIAHDVDPIELVVWLPALCRKKKIPFCVVKGKARLGMLVHKKTCSVIAVTDVKKELRDDFTKLVDAIKPQFLENHSLLRSWGEGKFGWKHRQAVAKEARRVAKLEKIKQ